MGSADSEFLRDLFSAFGPVNVRRMFGGAGLFCDGLMFGLVSRDVIYLKVDAITLPAFEREGAVPFSYMRGGVEQAIASYRRLPERLYDDPDELAVWARAAFAAAQRQAASKPVKTKARSVKPRAASAQEPRAGRSRR